MKENYFYKTECDDDASNILEFVLQSNVFGGFHTVCSSFGILICSVILKWMMQLESDIYVESKGEME